jgi:thymidine phosphorylase
MSEPNGRNRIRSTDIIDTPFPPLRVRPLGVDTLRENVVLLSRACAAVRPDRLAAFRRIDVSVGGTAITASVQICDDPSLVSETEIGICQPALRRLRARAGDEAFISLARPAASLDAVRAKIRGEELNTAEIRSIVHDLAAHRYSDMEVAAFLIASAGFMTTQEVLFLTQAMAEAGSRLRWDRDIVVDKHCIGGIPGNRTTMIVVPIVAAHGLAMPKTSSRAITSPAGTADTMEVLARVDLDGEQMRAVVETCNACIAWGGHVNLSPADDVLISVERPLSIDTPEQMAASILSKKIAAGSTHLLIDMPIGPTAKIRSLAHAQRVRKMFEFIGTRLGLVLDIALTDAAQPIGRGVGPALEARDVMNVLANRIEAPEDLREKSIRLAGRILEFDPALPGGQGEARARELLASGAAARQFEAIAAAQGPPPREARIGDLVHEVTADRDGWVFAIDCFRIARIARTAGAPNEPGAGVDLIRRLGEPVREGEPLYRIHAADLSDFAAARAEAAAASGFKLHEHP